MAHGKHRQETGNHKAAVSIITTGTLSLAGIAAFTGTASAAPESAWDKIAECESGGVWDLPYGDRDSTGGLQFRVASWNDALAQLRRDGIDTSDFPSMPYQASKTQQILAGEALLKLQGPGAWVCNGLTGGPLNGYRGGDYARHLPPVTPTPPAPPATPPSTPPVDTGLPKPNEQSPSAIPLQQELKRTGYMPKSVVEHPNYGPRTQAAVAAFHDDHPEYKWVWLDKDVTIGPKGWAHLQEMKDAAPKPPTPPAPPADPAPTGDFVSPLADMSRRGDGYISNGGCVSRSCGGHSGVDFSAPSGTPVRAVAAGKVIVGGAGAAYGLHVVIDHGNGVWTLYAHLSSISVSAGANVSAGTTIGKVGSTGNSSGPHLHFEVRTNGLQFNGFLDPVAWLRSHGILN